MDREKFKVYMHQAMLHAFIGFERNDDKKQHHFACEDEYLNLAFDALQQGVPEKFDATDEMKSAVIKSHFDSMDKALSEKKSGECEHET